MRLLNIREVLAITSMSRSNLYDKLATGDFPLPVRVGARAVRWRATHVQQWVDELPVHAELRKG